ncbi:MAG: hypothetical protein O2854_03900, partial [Chloroflexi bacterium]|nr:hypothetical protein [Chloroflexota bacterium]
MTTSVHVHGLHRGTSVSVLGGKPVPLAVPDMELWLKADAVTGVADGGTVATFADSSGNGRDATTSGDPTWHQGVKNGRAAWRLNGTDQYATVPDFAEAVAGKTVFVVAKSDDTPSAREAAI